ncbi:nucleotide-binding alpha-beta plait domain-containing protein [Tanacetum coccineum]
MGTFRSKEDGVQQISTLVFVTNFPDQFSAKDLWNTCKQYGYVVDTFIPNRKSKAGKRFGFVRFIKIFDVDRLVNNLCTVWVGRHKIHSNLARFQRPPMYKNNNQAKIGKSRHNLGVPIKTKGPNGTSNSYAHVVKGSQSHNLDSENIPAMMLDDSCLNQQNFNCCLMGKVKNFESLSNLKVVLVNEGFDNIDLKYMGGYWVMVKFQSGEAKKTFQSNVGIGTWFAKIQQASTDLFVEGRVAWVDIEGVPLKMWSDNTFKRIASKWGTLIHVDSHEDGNFYTKRICINTNIISNILESFKIIYRGKLFWVRAKEVSGWELDFMEDNDDDSDNDDDLINDLKKMKNWKVIVIQKLFRTQFLMMPQSILMPKMLLWIYITSDGGNGEDDFEIVKVRDLVGFYVVGKDRTRMWYLDILAHGEKPIQGTQFVSIDQAYIFYVAYDKKAGFDVRRGREYKAVGFGDATTKYFHCIREGFLLNPKEKFDVKSLDVDISEHSEVSDGFERFRDPKKKQTRRKPTFRCGCLASLTIKRIGNVFENQKKKISVFIGDRDAQMAVEKLLSRKLHSPGFYANYYKGDDDWLVGLFWADEEAIRNYHTFGDIAPSLYVAHHDEVGHKGQCKLYIKRKNDHESRYKTSAFKTDLPMEKEACKLYTRTLFFDVQDEMFASYKYCIALSVVQTENTDTYSVRDTQYHIFKGSDQFLVYQVEFYKSEIFESTIDHLAHDLDKLHLYKDKMKELLNQAEIDVPTVPKVSRNALISVMLGVDEPDNVLIGNLNLSKVKGTGCFSRMKPVAEVTVEEIAKRMTRSVCGGKEGHNKRTCTNEPASKKPKVQAAPKEKAAPKQQASQPRRFGLRSSTPK